MDEFDFDEPMDAEIYSNELEEENKALKDEVKLHRQAMKLIVSCLFGRNLAEDEHTDTDSICEQILRLKRGIEEQNNDLAEKDEIIEKLQGSLKFYEQSEEH